MLNKLLISVILFFVTVSLAAQFPAQSLGGSPRYKTTVPGAFGADSGLVLMSFSDTGRANASNNIKLTDGLLFKIGANIYMRDTASHRWISISSMGNISVTAELGDFSTSNYINLSHIALPNTLQLSKNGIILPPSKYSILGRVITLSDSRLSTDTFLSNYKF